MKLDPNFIIRNDYAGGHDHPKEGQLLRDGLREGSIAGGCIWRTPGSMLVVTITIRERRTGCRVKWPAVTGLLGCIGCVVGPLGPLSGVTLSRTQSNTQNVPSRQWRDTVSSLLRGCLWCIKASIQQPLQGLRIRSRMWTWMEGPIQFDINVRLVITYALAIWILFCCCCWLR